MGLLDELRQQSASVAERERREQERRDKAEKVYREETIPALERSLESAGAPYIEGMSAPNNND